MYDNCGICDANSSNDCVQDCLGILDGSAADDNCGSFDSNSSNVCKQDCSGDLC